MEDATDTIRYPRTVTATEWRRIRERADAVLHELPRRVVPDAVGRNGHRTAGALVSGQEEAVAAGLPNPVLQGLPVAYRPCRQVVEKGGPLDAGDGTLDR